MPASAGYCPPNAAFATIPRGNGPTRVKFLGRKQLFQGESVVAEQWEKNELTGFTSVTRVVRFAAAGVFYGTTRSRPP